MPRDTDISRRLEALHPRQRALVNTIYSRGGATLRELHARIPDPPPTIYGLRTLLNRLVARGLIRRRRSGRHSEVLYLPSVVTPDVQKLAFDRLADEYFGGSRRQAINALIRVARGEDRPGEA